MNVNVAAVRKRCRKHQLIPIGFPAPTMWKTVSGRLLPFQNTLTGDSLALFILIAN